MSSPRYLSAPLALLTAVLLLTISVAPGCGPEDGPVDPVDVGVNDDAGPDDAGYNDDTDTGPPPDPEEGIQCDNSPPQPADNQRCTVIPGESDDLLMYGTLLVEDEIYHDGALLVGGEDAPNRTIDCSGCDCADEPAAADATVISCPDAVISPGLINPHDHLTFAEGRPQLHGEERYDHRHDWRRGLRGHTQLSTTPRSGGHREVALYGELRMLFGGATSIAGSTGGTNASGLLRNLDQRDETEGLETIDVEYETFPLGDGWQPALLDSGCDYPSIDGEHVLESGIYLPHISEGIDLEAQNELHCLAGASHSDLIRENTSIIHGIAVDARDVALIADRGANLVWSPRTNIDLYGNTAPVPLYHRFGVPIALGTDWSTSGSMNMLRELECADYLNRMHYNHTFDDREIWKMATYNAAISMGAEHKLGRLSEGYVADITIFDARSRLPYRAVIDASVDDIALVMRGGDPLFGDADIIEGLADDPDPDGCEMIDMCERDRRACIEWDIGKTLADIESAVHPDSYPLFFCGQPEDEPTCVPSRPSEYDGISKPSDFSGDGIPDVMDNCPDYFNPIRPMDNGRQADLNGTGMGDVCDPCPISQDPQCTALDPDDWSGDGVPNDQDICPYHYNPDQTDSSGDGVGDACSPCPDHHITDDSPCPGTIYDIKSGEISPGHAVSVNDALVTAINDEGMFLQIHPDDDQFEGPEYSGLYVYLGSTSLDETPEPGDRIDIAANIQNFFGQIQLSGVQSVDILSSDHPLPDPVPVDPEDVATGGPLQQPLEGVLISIEDVEVTDTNVPPGPGDSAPTHEFIVDNSLHINNFFHLVDPFPSTGDTYEYIAGVLRWANDNSKLEPRDADDIIAGPPELERFDPPVAYLDADQPPQQVFDLYLGRVPDQPMVFQIDYSDDDVIGPDSVVFAAGEQSVSITLEADEAIDDPVTVSASSADDPGVEAQLVVYDDDTPRYLEDVDLPQPAFFTGDQWTLQAHLNVPAGDGGETIALDISPDDAVTYPDHATVASGERTGTFDIQIGDELGIFVAVLTHDDTSLAVPFEVVDAVEDNLETFANLNASSNSYSDGSFIGDAGFTWHYRDGRRAPASGAPAIDGTSLIFASSGDRLLRAQDIPGGITSFSVDMMKAFTGDGPRQLELLIDGESEGLSQVFGTSSDNDDGVVYQFTVDDLDVAGDFELELRSVGSRQVTVDNLEWTPGVPADDDLQLDDLELTGFSPDPLFVEVQDGGDSTATVELQFAYPALADTTVDLTYSDNNAIDGPDTVDVSIGQSAVDIDIEALQSRDQPVQIDAEFDGQTVTGDIHPFDDSTTRSIDQFLGCHTALTDTTRQFSLALDVPAGTDGLDVDISADPDDAVTSIPSTVSLNDGEMTASFDVTFGDNDGSVELEIDIGDDQATIDVDITDAADPLVEDFSNLGSTGTGYSDGSFDGNHDIQWSYTEAQRVQTGAIDGTSLRFGDDTSSIQADDLPGELSSFSVDMQKSFTNDQPRQLELIVNGETRATSQVFGDFDGSDDTVIQFEVDDLDVSCISSLRLDSIGGGQMLIDNITWSDAEL